MKVSVVTAADGSVAAVLCAGEVGSIVQAMQDDDVVFFEEIHCIFYLGQNLLHCSFGGSPSWRTHSDDVVPSLFEFVAGSPGMTAADDQNFRLRACALGSCRVKSGLVSRPRSKMLFRSVKRPVTIFFFKCGGDWRHLII